MNLVLDTKGMQVLNRKGCFLLKIDKIERSISPLKLTSISITTQCWISSSAIRLAIQQGIPIYFHSGIGNIEGRLWAASFGHLATNRRKQVCFGLSTQATEWVIELFKLKTNEQIENLVFLKSRKVAQSKQIETSILKISEIESSLRALSTFHLSECSSTIMGKEGSMARYYWQSVADCMPLEFRFENRNRRPAQDNYNAATNYLYGMLYAIVENAIFLAGLDPYLGFMHADEYNQPTLAFDLIEPFRPWIDRLLIDACLKNEVSPAFFEPKEEGIWLSKAGKQFFIPRFYEYLEGKTIFREKLLSRKNQIYRMAQDLSKILSKFEYKL